MTLLFNRLLLTAYKMEIVQSLAGFGYICEMKEANEPLLYPQEEVYLRVSNITIIDNA